MKRKRSGCNGHVFLSSNTPKAETKTVHRAFWGLLRVRNNKREDKFRLRYDCITCEVRRTASKLYLLIKEILRSCIALYDNKDEK